VGGELSFPAFDGEEKRRGKRKRRLTLLSATFVQLNYKLIAFYAYKFSASYEKRDDS